MAVEQEKGKKALAESLEEQGSRDVLVLDLEMAQEVITGNRLEIIEALEEGGHSSIRGLARDLGRDPSAVLRDLRILFRNDVVGFDRVKGRKVPHLKHGEIVVEPVLTGKPRSSRG